LLLLLATTLTGLVGCRDHLPASRTGDSTRKLAPPPACVTPLPARVAASGVSRTLREEAWWPVVFPGFDSEKRRLPESSLTCEGRPIFTDATFTDATVRRGGWPFVPEEGDVVQGAGLNKLRLLWFRTHDKGGGTMAGPLALVRSFEEDAEVYAIGSYSGNASRAKLRIERLGSDILPTVQDDGCQGVTDAPCETTLQVYLPYRGQLRSAAKITLERLAFANETEPGVIGRIGYHLVTTPVFSQQGITLSEQITVHDSESRELRRAELTRVFVAADERLENTEVPLWDRIVRLDANPVVRTQAKAE
jgi:hypothetical protein